MRSVLLAVVIGAAATLSGCQGTSITASNQDLDGPVLRITLDVESPAKSMGVLATSSNNHAFNVGYGKSGIACAGSTFSEGVTPIGRFRVNAILSQDTFVMDPELIQKSGKSEAYLKQNLFKNMNSIDFKGDGEIGEYGIHSWSGAEHPSRSNSTSMPTLSVGTASPSRPTTMVVWVRR